MAAPREDAGRSGRDTLNKVAGKLGEVATQAAATALLWRQLDVAQRSLARSRADALRLRAQIGEEMYKLWRAQSLPPSTLDELFAAIDRTMAEIEVQRQRVDELRAQFTGGTDPPPDPVLILEADPAHLGVTFQLPAQPPPVPAAVTRRLDRATPENSGTGAASIPAPVQSGSAPTRVCPTCGATGPADKPFCGYCGTRLS